MNKEYKFEDLIQSFNVLEWTGKVISSMAIKRLGHPYSQKLRGKENYVDCSYLVWWAYKQAGVNIPLVSDKQAKYCFENHFNIDKTELQAGDLIFWKNLSCSCNPCKHWRNIHHVAIYIGNGMIIDTSSKKGKVVKRKIWSENGEKWFIHSYGRPYLNKVR